LQTDVLPIGVTPVTAIPTRISHGPIAEAGIVSELGLRSFISGKGVLPLRKKIARRYDDMIASRTTTRLQIASEVKTGQRCRT
jgi:hypothetical protein